MASLYEAARDILITHFEIPADTIRPGATLEELDLDSLALAEFALILQEQLGVTVEDEDATKESTLDDVVKVVQAKLDAADAA